MVINLCDRTEASVRLYYEKAQQPEIKKVLSQKAKSVEEAVSDYKQTLRPDSASCGRTVYANGTYVGDVWCYRIDKTETPNAMLSFCIFERSFQNKGIATDAVALFLKEIRKKYYVNTIGAFTFSENRASQRVLEKSGFQLMEEFCEDGIESRYYQLDFDVSGILSGTEGEEAQ